MPSKRRTLVFSLMKHVTKMQTVVKRRTGFVFQITSVIGFWVTSGVLTAEVTVIAQAQ